MKTYTNELHTTTTLVSGKVLINKIKNGKEYTLSPNEQAVISDSATVVKTVNIEQYVAWKNGRIIFEENTLEEIFNDLSRWYNIKILYENDKIKKLKFSIDIKKYENFNNILDILKLTQKIKFEKKDSVITIKN